MTVVRAFLYSSILGFLFAGAVFAQGKPSDAPRLTYTVKIEGLAEGPLRRRVRDLMVLISKRGSPPASLIGLEQRAEADRKTIRAFLRSEGYYAARVTVQIPEQGRPIPVLVVVRRGPPYQLAAFRLRWAPGPRPSLRPSDLGISIGRRARAAEILASQQKLFQALREGGWPFGRIRERRVVVDHRVRAVRVDLSVDQRRRVWYGAVIIRGAPGVDHGLVRRRIQWRQGQRYAGKQIDDTREAIAALDVFESIQIVADESRVGPDGRTPIIVTLKERKPRSISVSGFFDTSLGPGAEVEWLHRNLFGGAERLTVRLGGTVTAFGGRVQFRKPDIFRGNEDLVAEARYLELSTPAYDGREAVGAIALEFRLTPQFTLSAGPVFDWARLNQDGTTRNFTLGGAIIQAAYDTRDSRLDPTRGYRASVIVAPYTGDGLLFSQVIGRVDAYVRLDPRGRFVLGMWGRYGIVVGEENIDLPANKRLFAGGGGSIRGYGFQRVSPLDTADNPTGGRALLEFGAELRYRFAENWGAAVFAEGGTVSRNLAPDDRFLFGVGAGLRYYSPVGVIRLDIATPLLRREGDSVIQFYISIGQAF